MLNNVGHMNRFAFVEYGKKSHGVFRHSVSDTNIKYALVSLTVRRMPKAGEITAAEGVRGCFFEPLTRGHVSTPVKN